jgi:glutaredoxin 3
MEGQPKIEIYCTEFCGYCTAARRLLQKRGLSFNEVPVSGNDKALAEMRERSGRSSVPQIFINEQPIGGFDELYDLNESGDLDKLLGAHGA